MGLAASRGAKRRTVLAVKIRMKRFGRANRAFFRINAMDSRAPRDGRIIEELGSYDPHAPDDRKVTLNAERIRYWLSVGAQPSDTVRTFLERAGIMGNKKVTLSLEPVTAASVARTAPVAEAAPSAPADEAAPSATETPASAAPAPEASEPESPATGGDNAPAEPESAAP